LLKAKSIQTYWLLAESVGIALGIIITGVIVICLTPKKKALYGDAKWAKWFDIKKAEPSLSGKKGIFLGKFKNRYLFQGGQSFVLLAAGTRQGKGISVVIPNCLTWGGSMVVTDIKFENYQLTAGFRQACGHKVYLFAPGEMESNCWNPLDAIPRDKIRRIGEIQSLATLFIVSEKNDTSWVSDGRQLFLGLALLILDNPELPFTLGEMYRQLKPKAGFAKHHKAILEGNSALKCTDPDAIDILTYFANMHNKQFTGVSSFVEPILQMFKNPILDAATSRSDFDLSTLRSEKQTIYLGINMKDIELYSPLLRLFYQQLVNLNSVMPTKREPYQVLLLMDEFAALGRMPALVNAVSVIAGFNLRFMAIVQSVSQLRTKYGDDTDTLLENIHTRLFFAAKNLKNATDITNELGDTTAESKSRSRSMGLNLKPGNETISSAKRGLLLPQEAKAIGQDAMIILSDNCPPIMAKKAPYFKTAGLLERCVQPGGAHGLFRRSNLAMAKKTTSQTALMEYVRPPEPIPKLNIVTPGVMTDPYGIIPTGGATTENVDEIARQFIERILGDSNE